MFEQCCFNFKSGWVNCGRYKIQEILCYFGDTSDKRKLHGILMLKLKNICMSEIYIHQRFAVSLKDISLCEKRILLLQYINNLNMSINGIFYKIIYFHKINNTGCTSLKHSSLLIIQSLCCMKLSKTIRLKFLKLDILSTWIEKQLLLLLYLKITWVRKWLHTCKSKGRSLCMNKIRFWKAETAIH